MKKRVYLSLGSNVGDRAANLNTAIDRMGALGKVTAVSSFYETEAVVGPQTSDFGPRTSDQEVTMRSEVRRLRSTLRGNESAANFFRGGDSGWLLWKLGQEEVDESAGFRPSRGTAVGHANQENQC